MSDNLDLFSVNREPENDDVGAGNVLNKEKMAIEGARTADTERSSDESVENSLGGEYHVSITTFSQTRNILNKKLKELRVFSEKTAATAIGKGRFAVTIQLDQVIDEMKAIFDEYEQNCAIPLDLSEVLKDSGIFSAEMYANVISDLKKDSELVEKLKNEFTFDSYEEIFDFYTDCANIIEKICAICKVQPELLVTEV